MQEGNSQRPWTLGKNELEVERGKVVTAVKLLCEEKRQTENTLTPIIYYAYPDKLIIS